MTIKQVVKLHIDYRSSPYIFYTQGKGNYSINGTNYDGLFVYTALTDYPQLDTSGSSGGVIKK